MLLLAISLGMLTITNALSVPGTCDPTISVVKNFDLAKYNGTWYEMYRYEQVFQNKMECVTATYIQNGSNVIVFNQGILNNTLYGINGTAVVSSSALAGEAKLDVTFPTNTTKSPYWVLDTNYLSYSLVYSCQNLPGNTKMISSWILSRTPQLQMNDTARIVITINNESLKTSLNWNSYRATIHGGDTCKSSSSALYPSVVIVLSFLISKYF